MKFSVAFLFIAANLFAVSQAKIKPSGDIKGRLPDVSEDRFAGTRHAEIQRQDLSYRSNWRGNKISFVLVAN
jgi:hypothetical protein